MNFFEPWTPCTCPRCGKTPVQSLMEQGSFACYQQVIGRDINGQPDIFYKCDCYPLGMFQDTKWQPVGQDDTAEAVFREETKRGKRGGGGSGCKIKKCAKGNKRLEQPWQGFPEPDEVKVCRRYAREEVFRVRLPQSVRYGLEDMARSRKQTLTKTLVDCFRSLAHQSPKPRIRKARKKKDEPTLRVQARITQQERVLIEAARESLGGTYADILNTALVERYKREEEGRT